jgi:hypothetical protein
MVFSSALTGIVIMPATATAQTAFQIFFMAFPDLR